MSANAEHVKIVTTKTSCRPLTADAHPGHVGYIFTCRDGMKGIAAVGCVTNEFYPLFPSLKC